MPFLAGLERFETNRGAGLQSKEYIKMTNQHTARWVAIDAVQAWDKNPRNNEHAVQSVADSIQRFGWGSPIIARKSDGVVIAGHTRLKAAQRLKMDKVLVRYLDLDPAEAAALALADNKIGELADWDDEGLRAVLLELDAEDVNLDGLGFSDEELDAMLTAAEMDKAGGADDYYTAKVDPPVYEPNGDKPEVGTLYDNSKTEELLGRIDAADIPEDVRKFLTAAAHRHTALRFDWIAEYYCHASEDVQRLMEESALVIIDFNSAIEGGFVQLTEKIQQLIRTEEVSRDA